MAHFPGWCLAPASPTPRVSFSSVPPIHHKLSSCRRSTAHPKRVAHPGLDDLYAPFAYCFPNGPLTVIDAFLTGLVSSNIMNSLHAVPLFPPLSRLQIETYITPPPLCYRSFFLPRRCNFWFFLFFSCC